MLDPDNRVHMTVEEQLKELLEKLDFVTSMRCSGARTKRIRLLRREINTIRYRQGQHPRNSLLNGRLKEEDEDDDEEEEGGKGSKADNGLSPSDKGGCGEAPTFEQYDFQFTDLYKKPLFITVRPFVKLS